MGILKDIGVESLNPFGSNAAKQWNLATGVYKTKSYPSGVVFFYEVKDPNPNSKTAMDQLSDSGGRRIAKYEYPYQDGQKLKDLGKKGQKFTFNIKFFGLDYQNLFKQFIEIVCDSNEIGTIVHPIQGAFDVRPTDWEFVHRHDEWSAVTIKITFEEDNTKSINLFSLTQTTPDAKIRNMIQDLVDNQASISASIDDISTTLLKPQSVIDGLKLKLDSISGSVTRLIGQVSATYSSNSNTQQILAQTSLNSSGSLSKINSGTVSVGGTVQSTLPPIFQVGFDTKTQASINAQTATFISSNKITSQQAIYSSNAARAEIKSAIAEITSVFGNFGYQINLNYRAIAISIQEMIEAAISIQSSKIKLYVVPTTMSLRMVAQKNNISYKRQNEIESLNPYLSSINYIEAGTVLTVPAA